ncbi:transcriptional regulator, PaaX family [Haloechinothrix alba]|uniref:Transcriptional regulator, PaaX family n=1 Tax=Haloechinothrix alba TaxID=664784 RepID=A0A238W8L4_9PSEU|nr:PaaX family transcriptional regulator C-terminal domain-containing protein [Haloechinothrix alba]SNR42882.1 transcriptional regulator, PaaX family [Haloechinothrix alba]
MAGSNSRPTVSRRRELSHTSARSLLMTILGEYVLPMDEPVWTATLVDVLALFDIEEKSARQALARTAAEGWLTSERIGRRVRWSLTAPGRRLLTEGAERIYQFGRDPHEWDGNWLILLVSVPESKRDLRHRLRTQLTWAGFGSPAPGVWVSPHVDREAEAHTIVNELDVGSPMSFIASYGQIGDEESMVARSWDLSSVEEHYEQFIDEFTGTNPAAGEPLLHAQTRLVHEWRRFPFLDPQLPSRLLPSNWSGKKAADLFHTKHAEWRDGAQRYWNALVTREPAA